MSAMLRMLLRWNRAGWKITHVTQAFGDVVEVALYNGEKQTVRYQRITNKEAAMWLLKNAI